MAETKHIARGTDLTLIVAGLAIITAAWGWGRYGTGAYTPLNVAIFALGVVCVLAGSAIVMYAGRRRQHR